MTNDCLAEQLFCVACGAGAYACAGVIGVAAFCVGIVIEHGRASHRR